MKMIARALLFAGMILVIFGLMPPRTLVAGEETIYDSEAHFTPADNSTAQVSLPTPTRAVPTSIPTVNPTATLEPPVFESLPRTHENSLTATSLPQPTDQPKVEPAIPTRLVISSIKLDIPVLKATWRRILVEGHLFDQWKAPKNAAGWHPNSALLGEIGNTVLNGHNNMDGEVFRYLDKVKVGDLIQVYGGDRGFNYIVTNTMILLENEQSVQKRLENASWIGESNDERLTLVTCWPYTSNTHRLIVVAKPVDSVSTK